MINSKVRQAGRLLVVVTFSSFLFACDDSALDAGTLVFVEAPQASAEFVPVVDGPAETRSTPFLAWPFDLSTSGYTEEEYLLSGTGNTYNYVDDAGENPLVTTTAIDVPYTTRILVRKPVSPVNFNGTVYVEILNPSLSHDVDFLWQYTHRAIMDDGGIWVGVTGTVATLNYLRDSWGQGSLTRNNSRYATLDMDDDAQSWDVLTQLGELLKAGNVPQNPLAGYFVERNFLVSFSRSAENVVTYAVSFHDAAEMPDGSDVYDGYFASGGSSTGKHVAPLIGGTRLPKGDARNLLPGDVPSIRYQTQTEMLPGFQVEDVRQLANEYPLVRHYEVAGAAHIDAESDALGQPFLERDIGRSVYFPPPFCPDADNTPLRQSGSASALLIALDRWVRDGTEPPPAKFISLVDDGGDLALDMDADGNVKGGVRPPTLDVPAGVYKTRLVPFAPCFLLGGYEAFDAGEMVSRYGTADAFLDAMQIKVDEAIAEGFLLPADGDLVMLDAEAAALVFP